jgi:transcriptional regulator with XRE-family HTH domain
VAAARKPRSLARTVTAKLRELRKRDGVTGEALAERLGIAVQNLRRIEAGQNLTLATLERIAKALGFGVKVTFVRSKKVGFS